MSWIPHILRDKNVLIGITGSIAAYKAAFLVRLLRKAGAEVKVVMSPGSEEFITPLTLATLAKNPVHSDFTEDKHTGEWTNHVELGLWADVMLIAPATANTLAKMVSGECDNLLMAVLLSARCPVMVAPAMDLDMFTHEATQHNLEVLRKREVTVIEPGTGELASGLEGKGRMEEPEAIVSALEKFFGDRAPLAGKKAMVTAGPTYESIDAVRFIGNHSSGKMGMAVANELAAQGAEVTLILGPTNVPYDNPAVDVVHIVSAEDLFSASAERFASSDITVMSAAVADYRPKTVVNRKMKKSENELKIELEPTTDVLKTLGSQKKPEQLLVGFALETDNELENAQGKLERKNLDLIVLNSLKDPGAGFGHDTNKVTLIDKRNKIASFELKSKVDVAKDIVARITELIG